jgi:O-antigen/teichoic acid export membrane protein
MTRTVVRGGALVTVAALTWHASNFVFNSICARLLGPAGYGTLAAVVALLYVVSPVLLAVQTVMSRLTSELVVSGAPGAVRSLLRVAVVRVGAVGVVVALAGMALSPVVASFLRLPSAAPLVILSGALGISLFAQLQRGVLQGAGRFGRFAVSAIVEGAAKVAAAAVLVGLLWRSEDAAVAAIGVSSLCAVGAGVLLMRFLPAARTLHRPKHLLRYSAMTLATLMLLSGLFSFDVVAAKHYLSPHQAGVYAAVALLGKVAFFSTSAVSVFSFPFFSARHTARRDSRRELVFSVAVISAIGMAIAGVYRLAPSLIVQPVFGNAYRDGERYAAWMAVAVTLYSIAYQTSMYLLSQRMMRGVGVLACAAVLQLALLYSVHSTIWQIVVIQLSVLGAAAGTLLVISARRVPLFDPEAVRVAHQL